MKCQPLGSEPGLCGRYAYVSLIVTAKLLWSEAYPSFAPLKQINVSRESEYCFNATQDTYSYGCNTSHHYMCIELAEIVLFRIQKGRWLA